MRVVTLLWAALIVAMVPPAAKAFDLSRDQQRRLEGGEVVVVDVLPPGGGKASQGGTAFALTQASPEAVWRVLVDYPRHPGLYPRVVDAEVLESHAGHSLVRYVLGIGPLFFGFHVDNYPDESRHRLDWRLAQDRRNELFRDSWGYWQIERQARGVVVTYAMAARTVLPAFLTRGAERDGLVETLQAVRARAEQLSGRRALRPSPRAS